jgi:DHA2 family methylenomycin A resistance protein-like MFS transporter
VKTNDGEVDVFAYRVVAAACLVIFLISLDVTIVNVALPTIQAKLAVPTGALGWTLEAYVIPFATLMLSGGALSDRYGPAPTFVTGIAIFGLGSLIAAIAPGFSLLALGRVVQGIGAATCMPSALAVMRACVPTRQLGKAIALWTFSATVAISAGPLLGGVLVQFATWRSIFAINIPIVLLAVGLLRPQVRNSRRKRPVSGHTVDIVGQALYAASSGLLIGGLILLRGGFDAAQWLAPIVLLVLAAAGSFVFYQCERRAADPVLPASLMRSGAFQSAAIIGGAVSVVNFGLTYCLGLYYGLEHGFTALKTGVFFLPTMVACGISALFVERIRKTVGDRRTVVAGLALELLGAVLLSVRPGDAGWIALSTIFIGLGNGIVIPPVTTDLLRAVDARIAGVASGAFSSLRQFGSALGVAVLGFMVQGAGTSVRVDLRSISVVCSSILVLAFATYLVRSWQPRRFAGRERSDGPSTRSQQESTPR